ncbi:MAG: UDP-glucose 4-epimerase [Labilithrix sp.]|nr:UDP-glucose 4-epimerase [Labilithrix sp.]
MQRWLVTGGVGFIGSHLSRALLARGDSVRVLDDFSDAPYPRTQKRANQQLLAAEFGDRFEVVEGCVADRELAARAVAGTDAVIHLAGLAGVRPSFADPARYSKVNVEGTASVLDAAQRAGHTLFLFASSSSVYGNSTPLPAGEDAPALEPESPYAASKRSAELLTAAMRKRTPAMRCCGLRFFTVYGPRQRPEMAITSFLRAILAGQPITVFGDGAMRRDFTHVDDIVRGVIAASERTPPGFRVYNLGSGAPVTLTDLVAAMGAAAGRAPVVEHAAVPLGDVDATFADITRAEGELGWKPQVKLTEGLASVVRWLGERA